MIGCCQKVYRVFRAGPVHELMKSHSHLNLENPGEVKWRIPDKVRRFFEWPRNRWVLPNLVDQVLHQLGHLGRRWRQAVRAVCHEKGRGKLQGNGAHHVLRMRLVKIDRFQESFVGVGVGWSNGLGAQSTTE